MRESVKGKHKHIIIEPGEYSASGNDTILSTILGSCVAVCLYDPIRKVIGMNHIMISRYHEDEDKDICKIKGGEVGFCAMDLLIDDMLKKGARRSNLLAKAFGGASLFKPYNECFISYCVGEENVRFVQDYLKKHSIRMVAQDLGGESGRKIRFCSDDFSVLVKKIHKTSNSKLLSRDNTCWDKICENPY